MALLRVFAHHGPPPAAFGVASTVSSGAVPPPIAVHWCQLVDQATVAAAGFGPPATPGPVYVGGITTGWPVDKPVDQGFSGGADFVLTRVCVVHIDVATDRFMTDFEFTLISPAGQIIPISSGGVAIPAPVGPGSARCRPIAGLLGKGVWTIEVRTLPGSVVQTSDFEWGAASGGVPYVGLSGSPLEVLLAVVFEGMPPVSVCHVITVPNTSIPCSAGGTASVQATFAATLSPAAPAYGGTIDWEVTDMLGNVVFAVAAGGTTEALTFPGSGDYQITAAILRPGCSPISQVAAKAITVLACGCPTLSGTLNASPSPFSPCVWNFYVSVNNPGAVPISYEWDFDLGGAPLMAVTGVPSASCLYIDSGPKTVRVTLKAGTCMDQRQTTIVVECGLAGGGS